MSGAYTVLVVDDEPSILKLLAKELSREDRVIHTATSVRQARERIKKHAYDVFVLDVRLPDGDGLDFFVESKGLVPDGEAILITGHGAIDDAVQAMRLGVYDYITKPFKLDRLDLMLDKAWQRVQLQQENRSLKHSQETQPPTRLVGKSAPIKHLHYLISKVAPTEAPVLITGESGAGKDVVAHSVHAQSARAGNPLIIKNCAMLQRDLVRSELFGHVKGAFTGATETKDGLMAFAHRGTLFLDEIGELPMDVQASLLRVLEDQTYRRMGENEERQANIRFLFATNRNLAQEVAENRFHEALFHRINVFNIHIPPLSERKEDIPLLVEFFLGRLCAQGQCNITAKAMQSLLHYDWPGNVRELRNVIERSIILSDNGIISEQALPRELVEQTPECPGDDDTPLSGALALDAVERNHIAKVLSFFDGNRVKAAQALGIGRKTLYRKIEKYGIEGS